MAKGEPCDLCNKADWERIRTTQEGKVLFICKTCPIPLSFPTAKRAETVFIRDYGNVSAARINEIRRSVLLPKSVTKADKEAGMDYYVGRAGENGKVQEKEGYVGP